MNNGALTLEVDDHVTAGASYFGGKGFRSRCIYIQGPWKFSSLALAFQVGYPFDGTLGYIDLESESLTLLAITVSFYIHDLPSAG